MKTYRIAALFLALVMAGSTLLSCGGTSGTDEASDTAAGADTEPLGTEEETYPDNLPAGLDFAGADFGIYVPSNGGQEIFYRGGDELSGDVVSDAAIQRNLAVEERLNIKLNHRLEADVDHNSISQKISVYLQSGDASVDFFLGQQYGMVPMITEGGFVNANELEHLDFSQPWWSTGYMDEISIGTDTRYFLAGDYILSTLFYTDALLFNKVIYENTFGPADDLYRTVMEGAWTMDKLAELTEAAYMDLNNNGMTDQDDRLGYVTYLNGASVDPFMYLSDMDYSRHEADGTISLHMTDELAVTLTEKVVGFFHQPGSLYKIENIHKELFKEGKALFVGMQTLGAAGTFFRDMTDDYGFLPYPKLDESQKNYRCLVTDIVLLGAVSGASQNLDIAGAVLEALGSETYRSVTPAWYETALKVKYSRDDISAQIIDIIHDAMTTDFIYACNASLSKIGVVMRTLVGNNSTDYISAVAGLETAVSTQLAEIVEAYEKAN